MISGLIGLYRAVFGGIQSLLEGWFVGLAARFAFAGVLFMYFWNSALTKIGPGVSGFFSPTVGAYAQILPKEMEAVGFDPGQLSGLHHAIVYAGTYAEFALPVLVVLGLFGRAAALGMIVFIAVQTFVDVTAHGVTGPSLGALFDKASDAAIWDQRTLWILPLLVLVVMGPGALSVDRLLGIEGGRDED